MARLQVSKASVYGRWRPDAREAGHLSPAEEWRRLTGKTYRSIMVLYHVDRLTFEIKL